MSGKISGMVWDLDLDPQEKYVLLAYADHADHRGNNVRPGVELIAYKTGYTERNVQKIVARLRDKGYLVPVKYASGGRGKVTEYRIDFTHARWTKDEPEDTLSAKGELDDTLSQNGEPEDTLLEQNGERKGEPNGEQKGELGFTPTLDPWIPGTKNPLPLPSPREGPSMEGCAAEGKPIPRASPDLPWLQIDPTVEACGMCNSDGNVGYEDQGGVWRMVRCPHDREKILAKVAQQGWKVLEARTGRWIDQPPVGGDP